MGLFGKLFGGQGTPPASPPPPRPRGGGKHRKAPQGARFTEEVLRTGPFPRRVRLRANLPSYNLAGSWVEVVLNGPDEFEGACAQAMGSYYKQFGMYRLPDGSDTIRWNETTWREIRSELEILYDAPQPG